MTERLRTGAITTHAARLGAWSGDGRPLVVFVHGLLTDSLASYYFTLGPAFATAGMDVLMYDLRGHGRSSRPATGYRLEDFVADLAALLDALGETRPAHVVGNSFGGTIATAFSAWHPTRVATVTMIESEPPVAAWTGHMADGLTDAKTRLAQAEAFGWIADNFGAHTARLSTVAHKIFSTTSLAADVPASQVIKDDLSALTRPLLALFGDESGLADQVPDLNEKVAHCRTVVLPDQGHSVLVERPEETRDLILAWVNEHTLAEATR